MILQQIMLVKILHQTEERVEAIEATIETIQSMMKEGEEIKEEIEAR